MYSVAGICISFSNISYVFAVVPMYIRTMAVVNRYNINCRQNNYYTNKIKAFLVKF